MFVKSAATLLLAVLALGAAVQPAAADTSDTVAIKVKMGDLNLASPQGAEQMMNRIHAAARNICQDLDSDPISRVTRYDACMTRVIGDAVARLNSPLVTAALHTGSPVVVTAQNSDR
jgi:UrcA family protein